MSFAIAKLVPGTNGEIDQWQNYVVRTETTTGANNVGSGAGGTPVLASAKQATTDPKPASQANQLVYHAEGYYTYTFSTDITDPAKTDGVVFEPNRTHRIAIQLSYTNDAGQTVLVNPYVDVTFDASGNSVVGDRSGQDARDGRRGVVQRLPREAGAAWRRPRRRAVLRDVPQPGHHRRQQRQRADDADDGAQDPCGQAAGQPGERGDRRRALHDLGLPVEQARLRGSRFPAGPAQLHGLPHRGQPEDAAGRQLEDAREQGVLPDLPRQRHRLAVRHRARRLRAGHRRPDRQADGHPEQGVARIAIGSERRCRRSACTSTRTRRTPPSTR